MARPKAKGEPFSIRLSLATERFVEAEARRTRRPKGAIVEALTEEAARMRRFPGIAFRGEDAGREAWVVGSGLDVWEIVEMLEDHGAVKRLTAETHLTERQVAVAEAYRESYPDEIDEALAENRRPLDALRELFPFVDSFEVEAPG
ncbi:MAG: hypothetical protein H0U03_08800 [Actinobacteria bacterium]|nr:hypothetical protein [Actinomycetota bacterium]